MNNFILDNDILFCGQGAGFIAVESLAGIFKALEEFGTVPGKALTSSGSTLFTSLYYSTKSTDWIYNLMSKTTVSDFIQLKPIQTFRTACSLNNYIFENENVYTILKENMTGEATKRVITSITRNRDFKSLLKKVTPAVTLAATSIPLIFKPVRIEADYYSDGGLLNNIPTPNIEEAKKWKHIFVFLSPETKVTNTENDLLITTLINLLNALMEREVIQLKESGFFDLPNVTLIQPESSLSGSLLSWSVDFELREQSYKLTKEILKNVKIN